MSEPEKPKKRRIWQIHLSTAVLFSMLASAMLWVNLGRTEYSAGGPNAEYEIYGWPMSFERYVHYQNNEVEFKQWTNENNELVISAGTNFIAFLLITAPIAFALEWLIRRREGRKP
jgi:hypothetical protein